MKKLVLVLITLILSTSTVFACGVSEQLMTNKIGVDNKFQAQTIVNFYNEVSSEKVNSIKSIHVCEDNDLLYVFDGDIPLHIIIANNDIAKISMKVTDPSKAELYRKSIELVLALHGNKTTNTIDNNLYNAFLVAYEDGYAKFYSDLNDKTYVLRCINFDNCSYIVVGAIAN